MVAGGGPTGLMLAAELALAGRDVAIVERRADQALAGSRARGLHARTIEVLDQRGIADRFLASGQVHYGASFLDAPLDFRALPSRHNYLLALGQQEFERILAGRVEELSVPIYRRREVTGFVQDDAGVRVALSDGSTLRSAWLAGCDGGRSVVRKAAGIAFPGHDATRSWLIAEARFVQEPPWGFHVDASGRHAIGRLEDGRAGIVVAEPQVRDGDAPSLQELRAALVAAYGTDFGIEAPDWISRFTDATRQAESYRAGRVLLAGDAAHVHPPMGGQGLGIGVQDAVNLGWKLAQVLRGTSAASLLETYHAERHPVAARVLRHTMAEVALLRQDARTRALGAVVSELLALDDARRRWAAELSGLAVQYGGEGGHPLAGRRMPDLDLATDAGSVRVFALLHAARPLLLVFAEQAAFDVTAWEDRVRRVDARCASPWELPAIGNVPACDAVLVRPDGYVAWAGDAGDPGLSEALQAWFGPPAAGRGANELVTTFPAAGVDPGDAPSSSR